MWVPGAIVLDSRGGSAAIRPSATFAGSLFVHVIGAAAHDTLKYAVDIFDDTGGTATATHDSNPWAADLYAGLPAAHDGRAGRACGSRIAIRRPIPAGAIGLRGVMGKGEFVPISGNSALRHSGNRSGAAVARCALADAVRNIRR